MKSMPVSCTDDRVALARRGALSPPEWQDFATHLTECVDCRIAWRLGIDFEESAAPRAGDERLVARGVKAALASSRRPHTRLIRLALAASVALAAAGAASAAIVIHVRQSEPTAAPPAPDKVRPAKSHNAAIIRPTPLRESPAAPTAEDQVAPPPALPAPTRPMAPAAPTAPATRPPLIERADSRPPEPAPQPLAVLDPFEGAENPVPSTVPPPHRAHAAGLFAQAVAERQAGRNLAAIATFRSLQREFPDAPETTIALVSLGDLLLDTGRQAEALRNFEAYLRRAPKGTLLPEAWIGKARALETLGRAAEARAAWSEIARRFPNSPYLRR
jgi:TolA-binding protein